MISFSCSEFVRTSRRLSSEMMLSGAGSYIRPSTYRYLSSYVIRSSVLKRVSAPCCGSYSRNWSMICALCHAGSSVLPSSTGGALARVAIAVVAEAEPGAPSGLEALDATTRAEALSEREGACAIATAGSRHRERPIVIRMGRWLSLAKDCACSLRQGIRGNGLNRQHTYPGRGATTFISCPGLS